MLKLKVEEQAARLATVEEALDFVKKHPDAIQHVPRKLRTEEVAIEAMSRSGAHLRKLLPEERTPAVCMAAIKDDGFAMQNVPDSIRTPEFCLKAARLNGLALKGMWEVEKLRTICVAAVESCGNALVWVPAENVDSDICFAAVQENGMALEFVPENLKTLDLCLMAVQDKRYAFKYVPQCFRNEIREIVAASKKAEFLASASPMESACADFAARAMNFNLPTGCLLQLETKTLDDGRFSVRVSVSDPQENCWPAGSAPSASAVYCAEQGRAVDPVKCLRLFAGELEGKTGKPVEGSMPAGMKSFCAGAVRMAADAAKSRIAAAAEREEESAGPHP